MPNTVKDNVDRVKAAKTTIGNAIVAAGGTVGINDGLEDFAAAIATIPTGGDLGTKTIDTNGTYEASSDNLDGYSSVTVEVPNSYVAGDEGKVVSNGALVAQTSSSTNANGTVDTTLINSLNVSVPNTYVAGDEGKVVSNGELVAQTSSSTNANGVVDTTLIGSLTVEVDNTYTAEDEGKVVSNGSLIDQSSSSTNSNGVVDTTLVNSLTVSVPNTYTVEDEGKVVNNGALVAQTSMPVEIIVNDTYDTTLYNSIVVNVPDIVGHTFIVATIPNATVTVTNASNTYTETADNVGEALFKSVAAGTYDVVATYDDAVSDTTSVTITDHSVTEDSFARLTISASDNTTITVTNGTVTKTLNYTGTPIVQYVSLGTWDLSCVIDETEITETVTFDSYINQDIMLVPDTSVSRYVDFTTNTSTITGDPATHSVYMGINRCNVADDGTINAYYGDAGYTEDGSNGQVMVKIPKFYYKVIPDTNGGLDNGNIRKCTWKISDSSLGGYTLHPAFYDAAGNEIDYFLYGAFDGVGQNSEGTYGTSYNTTSDKLASVAGSTYLPLNTLTRATARTMAANRGAGWYQAAIKQTAAVQMLMAVEYGFNTQKAIGNGVVSASGATYAGRTTGNITSGTTSNKTTPVNWRGIENFWGNIWIWIDGLNTVDRVPYICDGFNFVDATASGDTQIAFALPTEGYVTAFGYDSNNDWIFLPSESSSTAAPAGPIGDYLYTTAGQCVAQFGGRWQRDQYAGAFFWCCNNTASKTGNDICARLMFIPTGAV